MYRDIDGRNTHFDNALHILILHIGEGNIVTVDEREAGVIVLEVNGLTHALGVLVDEAEDALIGAGVLFIHQGCFKLQPDVIVFILLS